VQAATVESSLRALTDRHPDLTPLVWAKDGALNPVMVVFLNDRQLGAAEIGTPWGPAMRSTSCLRSKAGEVLLQS
jgi:hypothetical protein